MPCNITKTKVGTMFMCNIHGHHEEQPPKCYKCGKPATRLCDYRNMGIRQVNGRHNERILGEWVSLYTCDKPMCDACANSCGKGVDYCDEHANEFAIFKSKKADHLHDDLIRRLGLT